MSKSKEVQTPKMREMAIAVAKDMKVQILARKLLPKSANGYLCIDESLLVSPPEGAEEVDLKTVFTALKKPCEVCAIGAAFFCLINVFDEFSVSVPDGPKQACNILPSSEGMRRQLLRCFTYAQLRDMEDLFEMNGSSSQFGGNWIGSSGYVGFWYNRMSGEERLLWICDSIILNDGVFVLPLSDKELNPGEGL